jgi:hypothetical protein
MWDIPLRWSAEIPMHHFFRSPRWNRCLVVIWSLCCASSGLLAAGRVWAGELAGVTVTPHLVQPTLKYRRPHEGTMGARVQLFVRGPAQEPRLAGESPREWLDRREWTWQDISLQPAIPAGALGVWSFNGQDQRWGVGRSFPLQAEGLPEVPVTLAEPQCWITAVTFLASQGTRPDRLLVHVVNHAGDRLALKSLQLWLPRSGESSHTFWPGPRHDLETVVPAGEPGYIDLQVAPLPLGYAVLELRTDRETLWAQVRVRPEAFDISGGWIFDSKTPWKGDRPGQSPFLDILAHLHVNTAHYEKAGGYSDDPDLVKRYPLKRFHRLWPLEEWDTEEWLPTIHAVEFLGEPQYGGGRPVPPQEVLEKLLPYRPSRLATTVTHSEERIWRFYAGLSDYPHFDAYRVVAPAADAWRQYNRWGGRQISWGAPLETIGDLCRSLRELNRPAPTAVWSQGPHHDWGGGFFGGGRKRRSPTPDELRAQAQHALASRITSLYWFNLSPRSLAMFPDLWEPMTLVGREIQMLEPFYLTGAATHFERRPDSQGAPDWELSVISAPSGAVLFALDTAYTADPSENVFRFGEPRPARFQFPLPDWLRNPKRVVRVDAGGVHPIEWKPVAEGVEVDDQASRDRMYLVVQDERELAGVEARRQQALAREAEYPLNREAFEGVVTSGRRE